METEWEKKKEKERKRKKKRERILFFISYFYKKQYVRDGYEMNTVQVSQMVLVRLDR